MSRLEDAWSDVACSVQEFGLAHVLARHGLGDADLAYVLAWAKDDVDKASDLGHAVLLGAALAMAGNERTTA
jgi:hypothetical protein